MLIDFSYFVSNIFGVVFAMTLLLVFLFQNRNISGKMRAYFCVLCLMVLTETSFSVLEVQLRNSEVYNPLRVFFSIVCYIMRPAIEYVIALLMTREDRRVLPKFLLGLPLAVMSVLVATAPYTGLVFVIDSNNVYDTRPLNWITPFVLFFYMVEIIVIGVVRWKRNKWESITVFSIILFAAGAFGLVYSAGLNNNIQDIALALSALGCFMYFQSQNHVDALSAAELESMEKSRAEVQHMLHEVMETLSDTIDAKDKYTRGHSSRVAAYSKMIAQLAGLSDERCEEIYHAGLLHDIGKISIPVEIINKPGRLTDDEYEIIKGHSSRGAEILSNMGDMPYLAEGALYHHERFDGSGYPKGASGTGIPEIGRIIGVADAYDAMTSDRSYRHFLPQAEVREQIWRGRGVQFDPYFAELMLRLIDDDPDYLMREFSVENQNRRLDREFVFKEWWEEKTPGIRITEKTVTVKCHLVTNPSSENHSDIPTLILFDAEDGQVSGDRENPGRSMYREFACIRIDGHYEGVRSKRVECTNEFSPEWTGWEDWDRQNRQGMDFLITAVKVGNNANISISSRGCTVRAAVALPDSYSWLYMAFAGEHLTLNGIEAVYDSKETSEQEMRVIATETSPLEDKPTGDLPNIDCKGWRAAHTKGIQISGKRFSLKYTVNTYPDANRIWHSGMIVLFTSENGRVHGQGYREFQVLRCDGESLVTDSDTKTDVRQRMTDNFKGWDLWLKENKLGAECTLTAVRSSNTIFLTSVDSGLEIKCEVSLPIADNVPVYIALSGELCTLSDINIKK